MKPLAAMPIGGIIHTIPSVAELSAGPTYSVMRLCETLIELHQSASLAVLDAENHRPVPDYVRRFPLDFGGHRLGNSSALFRWMRKAAVEGEVSIIHTHNLWMMPTVYPGWVSRLNGTPTVCSPRGALAEAAFRSGSKFKKPFWSIVQRPSLRWVTCFHATAPTEVEDIRRHGFDQPIALIPNGIDVPTLERRGGTQRTMLYLGRIHPNKQVDVLVRAWARVEARHPDWQLRIVGPDNDARGFLDEMRRLALSLGLSRISFDGELTGDLKLDAYRTADAYVLPTKTENFGITIAEALAAGAPVITTTGAPWPDLSARGAGWWIDQGEEPLVAALEHTMSRSRQELEAMGRRGRHWMLNDYEWRTIASKMLDFYEWIAGGMEESQQLPWMDVCPKWRRRRDRKR